MRVQRHVWIEKRLFRREGNWTGPDGTGELYRHTSDGQWSRLAALPSFGEALYVPSRGKIWIGTRANGVLHTTDGGTTLSAIASTDGWWIQDIAGVGTQMIAVGSRSERIPDSNPPMWKTTGVMFRSSDGGGTWSTTTGDLACFRARIADGVLYLLCAAPGGGTQLRRSTDFGNTSVGRMPTQPAFPTPPIVPNDLWATTADDLWLTDNNGHGYFHSADGGVTWENFLDGTSSIFYAVWASGPRDVYVAGFRGTSGAPVNLMLHGHD